MEFTSERIATRATKTAARSVGSMAGEALPFVGVAVIVGATAFEIKDLCATIKDMNELKRAFDPSLIPDEAETTVCSITVPTKEELRASAKAAPKAAWAKARSVIPSSYEFPDVDGAGLLEGTRSKAAWGLDATKRGAGALWGTVTDAGASAMDAARGMVSRERSE